MPYELGNLVVEKTDEKPKVHGRAPIVERLNVLLPEVAVLKALAGFPREIALIVAQTSTGALKPNVAPLIDLLVGSDIPSLLVVMTQRPAYVDDALVERAASVVVVRDVGGPFLGWAMALALNPQLYGCDRLHLVSDVLVVATEGNSFANLLAGVRSAPDALQVLSASFVNDWHFQPHFVSLGLQLVRAIELEAFFSEVIRNVGDGKCEQSRFAWDMEASGYQARLLFQPATGLDPTVDAWPDMLVAGCPFVRASVLVDETATAALASRIAMLRMHGFDSDLLERVIRWESEVPVGRPAPRLLARPNPYFGREQSLTIACFAPWNVVGPIADLAHALVAAFRRAGHKVNLFSSGIVTDYPRVAPPVTIREFIDRPRFAVLVGPAGYAADMLPLDYAQTFFSAPNRVSAWAAPLVGKRETWLSSLRGIDELWTQSQDIFDQLICESDLPLRRLPAADQPNLTEWDNFVSDLTISLNKDIKHDQPAPLLPVLAKNGVLVDSGPAANDVFIIALDQDGLVSMDPSTACQAVEQGWVLLAQRGTFLAPDFVDRLHYHAEMRPDVSLFYADDVAVHTTEPNDQIRLKPEFDATLLASQDYVGSPVFLKTQALRVLRGLDPTAGTAVIIDIVFRAHEAGLSIARIPEVLLAWPDERVFAKAVDHKNVLARRSTFADVEIFPGRAPRTIARKASFSSTAYPPVTIIIPTCRACSSDDKGVYVERLLTALKNTDWQMDRLTVLVGDDHNNEPDWVKGNWPFRLEWHPTPRAPDAPFNYARKMNTLWQLSRDEQIVLMNDDVLPCGNGWLEALQTYALAADVGGVGGRLLYEDGRLQHAGIAPYGDGVGHVWVGRHRSVGTYQYWALVAREWSMVTGALFATRRSLLETVGGFDEQLRLEYNDTDLCLRLRAAGYRIVYTPDAEMVHAEKRSRGEEPPPGSDRAIFMLRWREWVANDPSWHPLLRSRSRMMVPQPELDPWYL